MVPRGTLPVPARHAPGSGKAATRQAPGMRPAAARHAPGGDTAATAA